MWTYFTFSSNAFHFLCEIACEMLREDFNMNMQPQHKQIWDEWVTASHNWLLDLFESATKQNGKPFYTLETINNAVSLNKKTMSNIIELRLEKERIGELNEWALAKETKESGFARPMEGRYLNWKVIVSGAGHEKRVYATREAGMAWTGIEVTVERKG